METKLAPGPWQASKQKGKPGHYIIAQIFDNNGKALARIEPKENELEVNAVAKLMAASRDLLDAAECVYYALKAAGKQRNYNGPLLRKAIIKAKTK